MGVMARATWCAGLALLVSACGGPAAPPPPPKAAAPAAKPGAPAIPDPKAAIDAATTAAAAATTATSARQVPGDAPKPGAPTPGTVAAATAAAALTPSAPKYDAGGRRDPFESLEARLGSDRSSVTTAKLTGVIHSGGIALALVETSDGIGYILKPGDTLADGRLLEIGPTAAVFSITPKPGTTINRVVLKLASD
jgi:hypothetical protein